MKQIKEERVDYDLTLDTWTRHTFVAPCVSRRRLLLLISSQLENDLDSPGCWMCLHTLSADDIVSQKASLSAARSGALFTVTKAPIHLPSWWNSVQSHRSLLSSDCMHDGVNGYWSFWLADSQDIWMLRLLDIFIFAVNCKLPSVIRLHKGFFSPKKKRFTSLFSPSSWIFTKGQVLVLLLSSLSPLTVSWITCPWFISCSRACSCPGCIFNIAEMGGVGLIGICFVQHLAMYQS